MGFLLDLARGRLTGEPAVMMTLEASEADREAREERAAIYEFDARLTRAEAEKRVMTNERT